MLIAILFSVAGGNAVQAQSKRKVLEAKKSRLKSDINYKNTLLKKTEKEKTNTLNQLVLLQDKIAKREELIATINSEVKYKGENTLWFFKLGELNGEVVLNWGVHFIYIYAVY